jgi:hypothetical protein
MQSMIKHTGLIKKLGFHIKSYLKEYTYTYSSLVLLLALVLPYRSPFGEPYPAVILPSGATKINVETSKVYFTRKSVWARKNQEVTWTNLSNKEFIAPIPAQYFAKIYDGKFGFNSSHPHISKDWIQKRLSELGFNTNEIRLTTERVTFDVKSQRLIKKEIRHEEIIELD